MIHVAAEPIPFFWPMRTFIHHNPLHGLEHLHFAEAAKKGAKLFHGRSFLPRDLYQEYLQDGKIQHNALQNGVDTFIADNSNQTGLNLSAWFMSVLTKVQNPVISKLTLADSEAVYQALHDQTLQHAAISQTAVADELEKTLLADRPIYEAVDALYGSNIGKELDELVVKSCLDFFDEGQSVWEMPEREQGFFMAWRNIASRNVPFIIRGLEIGHILENADTAEDMISHVLQTLGVPEEMWMDYFTRELSHLHGWTGFIRWRSNAKSYHWSQRFPGDLVDLMAIRLTLALALLNERGHKHYEHTTDGIRNAIQSNTAETYLRQEMFSQQTLPAMAFAVEKALASGKQKTIEETFAKYVQQKRVQEAQQLARNLNNLAIQANQQDALMQLSAEQLAEMIGLLAKFEEQEGMLWLKAMEGKAIDKLLGNINYAPKENEQQRPFAQAMFCIDTRSEPIRRHLEGMGEYQTYGIAGFFGVPVSFMELGKGSENHLAPVIVTPRNLVPEITAAGPQDAPALSALEKALHELKESVLTPFVTVEAIGLLFGFDMIGKTIAPQSYHHVRKHLHHHKPHTRLLVDKLSREQADSILRAVQRAVIEKAIEQDLGLETEDINDAMVRDLREAAMNNHYELECADDLGLDAQKAKEFIQRLQTAYRINESFADNQLERLGRIGFTVDEQVNYVAQALSAIGLTDNFSRFVLITGHGSKSENNPYESALDCGACGGNHGIVSAKVLAQMANRPNVRRKLRTKGIDIPDDTWFVPAMHNTTTDEVQLYNLDLIPPSHLVYLDRLRSGLNAASRLSAQERMPSLEVTKEIQRHPAKAYKLAQRNSMDWSQVRPEWGLSRNAYFIIGRRQLTQDFSLESRAFLHSYDYRVDHKNRLLENILTGPLVVGQWINMEHYFSAVDNESFGSGSKVSHNVAGRFGVMTGNLGDLRTGLPSQTVLKDGKPYHEPLRLIAVIEAPFEKAKDAIESVVSVKKLVTNAWIRMLVIDPEDKNIYSFEDGAWQQISAPQLQQTLAEEKQAS
ncbi:DUF2309 domain-containing protein [Thiomicrorhabdus sediminis]|uniref:Probable inorganic carbon transporter subunit DabA n=2 Tax=Thiomicrorhabdus sediminis TaxID=2580412 RepID=A0A4P9K9J1_9GAMM|nr:DUF2309 domain-containing protein [Thiomicrorhabdus sediminis]